METEAETHGAEPPEAEANTGPAPEPEEGHRPGDTSVWGPGLQNGDRRNFCRAKPPPLG